MSWPPRARGSGRQARAVAGAVTVALTLALAASLAGCGGSGRSTAGADTGATLPTTLPSPTLAPGMLTAPPSPTSGESGTSPSSESSSSSEGSDHHHHHHHDGAAAADAPLLPDVAQAGHGPLPDSSPVTCPTATVTVSTADQLTSALANAEPGDSIRMLDGTYAGNFTTSASGTDTQPIFLCGDAGAVIDGGDISNGYAFHLDHATHWRLVGFTIQGAQKGVVADGTVGTVIQGLTVTGTGDEAIHLRDNSTDNVVLDNTVSNTGNHSDKYGEGIYIGTSVNNWCTYTNCQVDRSDRNVVKGNHISHTTAESVDIKEGTTGGAIIGNTFDGAGMTGADSWVDVKGNNYLIADNTGTNAPQDGFQTHQILPGWGDFNVFVGNHAAVDGPGYAINSEPPGSNTVLCNNTATGAAQGLSNIPCSQ